MESNGSTVSYSYEHSEILWNQVHAVCTVQLLLQRKKKGTVGSFDNVIGILYGETGQALTGKRQGTVGLFVLDLF